MSTKPKMEEPQSSAEVLIERNDLLAKVHRIVELIKDTDEQNSSNIDAELAMKHDCALTEIWKEILEYG